MKPELVEWELRKMLWLQHGSRLHGGTACLYGDDGELQCGMDFRDYKREPLDHLLEWQYQDGLELLRRRPA